MTEPHMNSSGRHFVSESIADRMNEHNAESEQRLAVGTEMMRSITQQVAELLPMSDREKRSVALLRELEWNGHGGFCPRCRADRGHGHTGRCELAAVLPSVARYDDRRGVGETDPSA